MQKQEVEKEHSSFASSRNAVSAFSFPGAVEGVSALLVQRWEDRLGNQVFSLYPAEAFSCLL